MSQPSSPAILSWSSIRQQQQQQDSWKSLFQRWPASAQPLLTPLLSASPHLQPSRPAASQNDRLTAEALDSDADNPSPAMTGGDAHSFVPFGTLWAQSKALGNLWASLHNGDLHATEWSDKGLFRPEAVRRAEQHPKDESRKRRPRAYCMSAVGPLQIVDPA